MAHRRALAPVLLLTLAVGAGGPAGAHASTIAGRVGGGTMPAAGKGLTTVRAVDSTTLAIAAVGRVRSGRYRLTVPSGTYRMFAATIPFRGRAGVDRDAGAVTVRKGGRATHRISLRKPRLRPRRTIPVPKIPGLMMARAAFVAVKYPAVWIQHFTVTGGPSDFQQLRKGLADMLISDVARALPAACGGVVVEREKLNTLLAEQTLQQSPAFDPRRRIAPDRIIGHNREVTGTLAVSGATSSLTATVTNVVTGGTRSVTRSGATDRVFELEQSIVQELVRLICGGRPPAAYSGPVSGSVVAGPQTLSWSGTVRLKRVGEPQGASDGDPPGTYALYEPESGSVHFKLDGTTADCTYHGEGDATIVPNPGQYSRVQQEVDEPHYALQAGLTADAPPLQVTTTGPEFCGGGTTSPFGLAGRVLVSTQTTLRSATTTLTGSVAVPVGNVTTTWRWSLEPQAG